MKRSLKICLCLASLGTVPLGALVREAPTAWSHFQEISSNARGLVAVNLPLETLDRAASGLADLRVLSPAGGEVAYTLDAPLRTGLEWSTWPAQGAAEIRLAKGRTTITASARRAAPLESIQLDISADDFLKAATLELRRDGTWRTVLAGRPVYRRRYLAEDLNLVFPKQDADAFRITLDDADTDPVIVRAATPRPTFRANAPLAETPLRILRREDGPVETRITVELPARNVLLAEVVLAAEDAAFQRPVRVVRRVRSGDENAFDEILGAESLCRWPGEDGKTFERLSIPVARRCDSRDVDIVVANGDNPPLKITSLGARVAPTTLVFNATEPGTYRLILGNSAAGPVRYDLDGLRDRLDKKQRILAEAGPLQSNPAYAPPAVAADLAESAAALDPKGWRWKSPVRIEKTGVQRLELSAAAVAGARSDGGDLRLLRDGRQVPFVVDRRVVYRVLAPTVKATDAEGGRNSVWEIQLPVRGLPVSHLEIDAPEKLFSRRVVVEENRNVPGAGTERTVLGGAQWFRRGETTRLLVPLTTAPSGDRLRLTVDNGDNAPLALANFRVHYRTYALVFKAKAGDPLTLHYGNPGVNAPAYDAAAVESELLAADKVDAVLESPEKGSGVRWIPSGGGGGPVLWAALILATGVLLWVIAKLLPPLGNGKP